MGFLGMPRKASEQAELGWHHFSLEIFLGSRQEASCRESKLEINKIINSRSGGKDVRAKKGLFSPKASHGGDIQ